MDQKEGPCAICSTASKTKCSSCNQVFYCNVQHQKQDWKMHKRVCRPFAVLKNDTLGRHLIASRSIKKFEVILKESALIRGPSQITPTVCLGCLNILTDDQHVECTKCGWPVCELECQNNPEHGPECKLAQSTGHKVSINYFTEEPHKMYQCIAPVRALLLKETDPERFKKLTELEGHEDKRRGSAQWKSDIEHIAQAIPRIFKCDRFSEEEIMKVTGVLQINGHEVPTSDPPHVAVYYNCSFLEHSCLPNLTKSFTKNGDVILWATQDIKKGTHLSICYSDAVWGTAARQHHLMYTKLFKCECVRCKDVTELGTNYSALRCRKPNCPGVVLPETLDDWLENWKCRGCGEVLEKLSVERILENAGKDLQAMPKKHIQSCIKYIEHHSKYLHKNHFLLGEVKIQLIQYIGGESPESLKLVDDNMLEKKIQLAKEVIPLLQKLTPSDCRILGILCFELHSALSEQARRTPNEHSDTSAELLKESFDYAQKTISYLQYEPAILSEGQILKQAKLNCEYMKMFMGF